MPCLSACEISEQLYDEDIKGRRVFFMTEMLSFLHTWIHVGDLTLMLTDYSWFNDSLEESTDPLTFDLKCVSI